MSTCRCGDSLTLVDGVVLPCCTKDLPYHPAKYTLLVLQEFAKHIRAGERVLDPMAGTGKIHQLRLMIDDVRTFGVELELEWAVQCPVPGAQIQGDGRKLPFPSTCMDVIACSPPYGNRYADTYAVNDSSKRFGYHVNMLKATGHGLRQGNAGSLHFKGNGGAIDQAYLGFHRTIWRESLRCLRPGGTFILNISNFIASKREVDVTKAQVNVLVRLGLDVTEIIPVQTPRMGRGENRDVRVDRESVIILKKPMERRAF